MKNILYFIFNYEINFKINSSCIQLFPPLTPTILVSITGVENFHFASKALIYLLVFSLLFQSFNYRI